MCAEKNPAFIHSPGSVNEETKKVAWMEPCNTNWPQKACFNQSQNEGRGGGMGVLLVLLPSQCLSMNSGAELLMAH